MLLACVDFVRHEMKAGKSLKEIQPAKLKA